MEHYEISQLLNDSTVWKFVIRKWIKTIDLSNVQYPANRNIRFNKTSMLR